MDMMITATSSPSLMAHPMIIPPINSEGELVAVIIMSMVFILDMLSSLWQRVYFKLTHGKRFFKKAPVHHHFQLLDWSEIKIVTVFFLVSLAFCAIGVLGAWIG